ncbi:MAG: PAS domain-containing protein [Proteobacteria bacterium]|nr:PAS domain-containing protein [Pseudomonadota bacterium]
MATLVALVDDAGCCRFVNTAFEAATGLSRRHWLGTPLTEALEDGALLQTALASLRAGSWDARRFDARLLALHQGGGALPVQVSVGQGDAGLWVVELTETSHLSRWARQAREDEDAQGAHELVRNLAHEIKNPLGGLRGAAQLLALDLPDAALREYTDVIIGEADRLQALVDRLLAPHRHASRMAPVNIHEACERVRALMVAEFPKGLAIRRDYDASLPDMQGDAEQLIQMVLNLVRNAAQALAPRIAAGDADILLRTRAARQVTLHRQRHKLALELQVHDNGPGIPEALRERLFQPLASGREGGFGLGLAMVHALVQRHHGAVTWDSAPGHTVFTLQFPLE